MASKGYSYGKCYICGKKTNARGLCHTHYKLELRKIKRDLSVVYATERNNLEINKSEQETALNVVGPWFEQYAIKKGLL